MKAGLKHGTLTMIGSAGTSTAGSAHSGVRQVTAGGSRPTQPGQPNVVRKAAESARGAKLAGNRAGGIKARNTMIQRYGAEVYEEIGRKGGSTRTDKTHKRGFASNRELAREAGKRGGIRSGESRRGEVVRARVFKTPIDEDV